MTGIVFNTLAIAHFFHHFQVKPGALFQTLGFDELVHFLELPEPRPQFLPDGGNGSLQVIFCRHIVTAGIDGYFRHTSQFFSSQWVNKEDGLYLVSEKFHPDGFFLFVGRENLHDVAADAKSPAVKVNIVAFILDFYQTAQHVITRQIHSRFEGKQHALVGFG